MTAMPAAVTQDRDEGPEEQDARPQSDDYSGEDRSFLRDDEERSHRGASLEGLTFHRLRHSAGHLMREAGVPLEVIQRRLGQASIRTTADVYGSLPESVDRAVAEKLDELFDAARGAAVVQPNHRKRASAGHTSHNKQFSLWR